MTCECCLGACCTGYDCQELSKAACDDLGGEWQGVGTRCTPDDPCVGICCEYLYDPDIHEDLPGCTDYVYEDDCDPLLWIREVHQFGLTCADGVSQPLGTWCVAEPDIVRCCLSDGSCNDTSYTAEECVSAGGTVSDAESCTPNPCCIDDTNCAACECCGEDGCEAAVCPSPTVDSASWCGITGLDGSSPEANLGCGGNLFCVATDSNTGIYGTTAWGASFGLIETVACGGTQTTTIPGNPSIASGNCRYIYEIVVVYGHGGSPVASPCFSRRYLGYLDTTPCSATGGPLTIVEDTSAAFDGTSFDPDDYCGGTPPGGCSEDCLGLCPDYPEVEISFPL